MKCSSNPSLAAFSNFLNTVNSKPEKQASNSGIQFLKLNAKDFIVPKTPYERTLLLDGILHIFLHEKHNTSTILEWMYDEFDSRFRDLMYSLSQTVAGPGSMVERLNPQLQKFANTMITVSHILMSLKILCSFSGELTFEFDVVHAKVSGALVNGGPPNMISKNCCYWLQQDTRAILKVLEG